VIAGLLLSAATAASQPQADVVATYRDGRLERSDLEAWRRYLGHEGDSATLRSDTEELVVVRVLASRFEALGPTPEQARQLRLLAFETAEAALRSSMAAGIHVDPAEVAEAVAADPGSKPQPRRYALENIFKRCPTGCTAEQQASLRLSLEALKARVLAGEDFAELARTESDSETRLRGGVMGYVALERLSPEVRTTVQGLEPGQLAILESGGGVSLLRLARILEPAPPDLGALRHRLEGRLAGARAEAAWAESSRTLQEGLRIVVQDPAPGAAPETVVATFRGTTDGKARELTLAELRTFLEKRGRPRPEDLASADERRSAIVDRILLEAHHDEADRRGLLAGEPARRLEWKSLELKAQLSANALAGAPSEPGTDELRAAYDAARDQYRRPERWRLRVLRMRIDPGQPAAAYEEMRLLGDRARAGTMGFPAVAEALGARARVEDLGWLDEAAVWRLGLNAETALRDLPAGASTRAVQEGQELLLFNVMEHEEDRPLSFEEARAIVRSQLLARKRQEAGKELRRSILAEQDVRVAS
jgi:hypothetical protein